MGKLLLANGYYVWGLRRDPSDLPYGFNRITCDLANLGELKLGFDPDYVFFMPSAGKYDLETYKAIYTKGAENLIKCLNYNKSFPKRIFYISSTSVYTQNDGEWVNENSPIENITAEAECLINGEELLLNQFPLTVVRFGGIYGTGRKYLLNQIIEGKIKRSLYPSYINNIHQDDCASLLKFLMLLPNPRNLYLGVDSEPSLKNNVIEWLSNEYKLQLPDIVENKLAVEEQRRRGNKRCSNQLILSEGYKFIYPSFRDGYAITS